MSNQNDNYFAQPVYIFQEMQFQIPSFFMLPFKMSKNMVALEVNFKLFKSFLFLMIPFQAYFNEETYIVSAFIDHSMRPHFYYMGHPFMLGRPT